ncbi:MAG: chromosome segregation protein SMC [Lachnospiraceae bacterium]|nr:chromosome segregation protein SMC [Lachnospiraceae bacterium]
MYLKAIEVHGFKSFANKIVFDFHNGITGIVGPNGSGKSNVADAVRWVLGEQSAKQLRGASMQDVIFAGTESRKPLGYAYVAITLDNGDKKLPVDFEEVTVARRVYRSGESEYSINGKNCRLKDVQELFYDTGIGKEGYSIIGQGQIDRILSGKPEERRELFDEAAGIVKFKRRKQQAQKNLEEEKKNLTRVNDILSELEKQVGPLERQSAKAKEYLKLKEELKTYDVNLFLLETKRLQKELEAVEEKIAIAENDLKETRESFDKTKEEYDKTGLAIEDANEKLDSARDALNQAKLLREKLEGQINLLKEQIRSAQMNDEVMKQRKETVQQEIQEKHTALEDLKEERQNMQLALKQAQGGRNKETEELEALQKEMAQLSLVIEQGKNDIIQSANEKATTKSKMSRYDAMLEQITMRKAELNSRLLQAKSEDEEQEEIIARYGAELTKVKEKIADIQQQGKQLEVRFGEIQTEIKEKNTALNEANITYHREKSRLDSLKNITERYDGYGNSIRKVMEKKDREKGIYGVVADLIKVEKKYEIAVETALGGTIQNIVTDNEQTAKRMIQYLKENRFGRATFLPLTSIGKGEEFKRKEVLREKGVIGLADSLVSAEEQYDGLTRYLLGRTVVLDHIDNAIALAKKYSHSLRIVTLEGESLNPGGSMSGGAFKNASNLLGRRREMEELEKQVEEYNQNQKQLTAEMEGLRTERESIRSQVEELKQKLQECYLQENTAKLKVDEAEARKAENDTGRAGLRMEAAEIENQISEIRLSKDAIESALREAENYEQELEQHIQRAQADLNEKSDKEQLLSEKVKSAEMSLSAIEQKEEFIRQNESRIQNELKNCQEELEGLSQDGTKLVAEIQKKEKQIEDLILAVADSNTAAKEKEEGIQGIIEERENLSRIQKNCVSKREELSARMNDLDKETYRLHSQKEKLEDASEQQNNYMWEEYELTYNNALELKTEGMDDLLEIKKHVSSLRIEIKKLGDVNVNAIEEYKEVGERYEFLNGQRNDLVESEEKLKQIILELDEGMRRTFTEKFEEIKVEFDKVFKALFGGGKGTLELTEGEDILEAGVKIIAQPPGKKLQNMMQLSGGEKAMSAIALLFAIQNLKPSPFCLLDEIEAALDEANVSKFANYLHKLTKHTQFIIITHRRGTMAVTDRLYGITMQEKGISTLVSVNLIEDELDE